MRILHRRGKASEWLAANPILAAGEIGIEFSDENPVTIAIKAGDGTRHWVNLPYAVGSGEGGGGGVSLTAVDILAALLGVDGPGSALDADTLDGLHAEDITTMASLVANNEATNAIASLSSVYQPLDSDLSAIAALSTTSFGRSLLTLADATAVRSVLSLGTAATQAATSFEAAGTIATHSADTTDVHGIADTASLVVTTDGRLSNARTPTAHASTHAAAGSDPIAITAAQVTSGTLDIARIPAAVATDAEVTAAIAALSAVYQPIDSDLTAIAALTTTVFGRSLLALADAAAARTSLGLGTAATQAASAFDAAGAAAAAQAASQPLDSDLTAIAALTTTTFGRAVLALADAGAARTHLGLGTAAVLAAAAVFAQAQQVNAQTGTTYTLAAGDAGCLVMFTNAAAVTLTVPQDSDATIPVGTYVELLQGGAGQVTVVAGTGATLRVGGLTAKARAQWSSLGVQKFAANTWRLYGDLAAS